MTRSSPHHPHGRGTLGFASRADRYGSRRSPVRIRPPRLDLRDSFPHDGNAWHASRIISGDAPGTVQPIACHRFDADIVVVVTRQKKVIPDPMDKLRGNRQGTQPAALGVEDAPLSQIAGLPESLVRDGSEKDRGSD